MQITIGDLLVIFTAKDINAVYNNYHVIGLQRTGTNWINDLIHHNFEVEPVQTGFWKHLTPLGATPRRKPEYLKWKWKSEDLVLNSNTLYIATSKRKSVWEKSLKKNSEDFSFTHRKSSDEVYEAWHKWKDSQKHKENFLFYYYDEWYNNWETYLEEIYLITKWKKKHNNFKDITWKVYGSKDFRGKR
jgi:hypothetical protein